MILTRTPLRVSLFGGGSDLPSYCEHRYGGVLSTTIDKYMYIALCRTAHEGIKVVYNEIEQAKTLEEIKHSRVRHCLQYYQQDSHLEISSFCEIPTKGTGLGSSSTFTVGLINALDNSVLKRPTPLNKLDIAKLASDIEINMCGEPIGRQDQYAAAIGGLNIFTFHRNNVSVTKADVDAITINKLDSNLLMFYTGQSRNASDVLTEQSTKDNSKILDRMVDLVGHAHGALKECAVDDIGEYLNESWQLKKQLSSNVSNYFIDLFYDKALNAGALGGKILGAGNGGYLLFYVPQKHHNSVRWALEDLKEVKFNFEDTGTTVVYNESKRTF